MKDYGACGIPAAVCFVFGVFNQEFPSKMVCPSLQAMSGRQLVDFQISKRHGMFPNRQLHQSPGGRPPVSPCHWCTGLRKIRSGSRAILGGIHPRWGPEGGVWPMLDAVATVSLVAARGVRDLEKMSGCRRNVKIGKLLVLQAEAALLMQRFGSRLQLHTRTRPATRGTQLWLDVPLWGLLRWTVTFTQQR